MLEEILDLYRKYPIDLAKARAFVRKEYNDPQKSWWPQFDDLEAEISYLRIREAKPKTGPDSRPNSANLNGWWGG